MFRVTVFDSVFARFFERRSTHSALLFTFSIRSRGYGGIWSRVGRVQQEVAEVKAARAFTRIILPFSSSSCSFCLSSFSSTAITSSSSPPPRSSPSLLSPRAASSFLTATRRTFARYIQLALRRPIKFTLPVKGRTLGENRLFARARARPRFYRDKKCPLAVEKLSIFLVPVIPDRIAFPDSLISNIMSFVVGT